MQKNIINQQSIEKGLFTFYKQQQYLQPCEQKNQLSKNNKLQTKCQKNKKSTKSIHKRVNQTNLQEKQHKQQHLLTNQQSKINLSYSMPLKKCKTKDKSLNMAQNQNIRYNQQKDQQKQAKDKNILIIKKSPVKQLNPKNLNIKYDSKNTSINPSKTQKNKIRKKTLQNKKTQILVKRSNRPNNQTNVCEQFLSNVIKNKCLDYTHKTENKVQDNIFLNQNILNKLAINNKQAFRLPKINRLKTQQNAKIINIQSLQQQKLREWIQNQRINIQTSLIQQQHMNKNYWQPINKSTFLINYVQRKSQQRLTNQIIQKLEEHNSNKKLKITKSHLRFSIMKSLRNQTSMLILKNQATKLQQQKINYLICRKQNLSKLNISRKQCRFDLKSHKELKINNLTQIKCKINQKNQLDQSHFKINQNQQNINEAHQIINKSDQNINQSDLDINQSDLNINQINQKTNQNYININQINQKINQNYINVNKSNRNINKSNRNINKSEQLKSKDFKRSQSIRNQSKNDIKNRLKCYTQQSPNNIQCNPESQSADLIQQNKLRNILKFQTNIQKSSSNKIIRSFHQKHYKNSYVQIERRNIISMLDMSSNCMLSKKQSLEWQQKKKDITKKLGIKF